MDGQYRYFTFITQLARSSSSRAALHTVDKTMLRSRTNANTSKGQSIAAAAPVSRRSRRRQKRGNGGTQLSAGGGSVRGIIAFFLAAAALCLVLYQLFSHGQYNHVVKTMHLRKSAFKSGGIESPQQDDLVPEDSIYNLMYPSLKHDGELLIGEGLTIWSLSRRSRPSQPWRRHRVAIRPLIQTRGSENSVSCTRQSP